MNRYGVRFMTAAAITAAVTAGMPLTSQAASNFDLRRQVVKLAGITSAASPGQYVTRQEFAQMLVNSTAYRVAGKGTSVTAVFSDVPASSQYASAIRIAVENGWMTGYLGGVFKPEQQITMQEAARGLLALLGYTDEDFSGNQLAGRWAQYQYLDLGENISKEPAEIMTQQDCVNLFYNLLRTETKSGQAYCATLGYELSSDGEVNPLTIADNELKGPKVIQRQYSISDYVPFDVNEATFYLNGDFATLERVKQEKSNEGFVVIYYNTASKTIWAYGPADLWEGVTTGRAAIRGEVKGIYYQSSDVMVPSTVMLEDSTGDADDVEFKLGNSDVQFGFSIYGDVKVGDHVVLICDVASNSNGESSFTVIDYVKY